MGREGWEIEKDKLVLQLLGKTIYLNSRCSVHGMSNSSSGRVLGDGLGTFGNGVSGELSGEDESDGGLDLTAGEGLSLVVSDESGGFSGDSLEDIVDEGVHDAHGLLGDSDLGVDLLEDSVDVDGEGLNSLIVSGGLGDNLLGGFSGGTGSGFGHVDFF